MDKLSYALGMSIAHNMMQSGVKDLKFEDFTAGLRDSMTGRKPAIPFEEAGEILNKYFATLEEESAAEAAEIGEAMKKDGEAFLAANKNKPGVITLPSGLQYKVLREGGDKMPGRTDKVRCHYEGKFTNGQVFDSSYKRGEPAVFGVNQVIAGWTEALQLMGEGAEWELYIPYNLAYGEAGAHGAIPPYAALIFKVELIEVL
ncbi:MAG: FKBP-type peptidyl-prolyl cis-trans isomerase [Bacteroidales bacterium]|nr:FKBP-type peptidyl-prolyl cis-trans isomerase [Bacteroidales bacterium]